MILLVPSRGRPERAASMAASAIDTSHGRTLVTLIIDPDDEALADYRALGVGTEHLSVVELEERVGYTASLNAVARRVWHLQPILGAFGDDVIFRTDDWDTHVDACLTTPGIAFGDDLIHRQNHPTAVWMSSVIAQALGWLALPATSHQWADDGWKRLGQELGLLRYIPEVIVEHMHPAVGKADWDATYESVFSDARAKADYDGFMAWVADGLASDAAKVRAVLA